MVVNIPPSHAIENLLKKVPTKHQATALGWNRSMLNGDTCYGRIIGFDTRRIYLNAAAKFWQYLRADCSNLYEATIEAIEAHRPEQYSSKKHIKEASISLAKYLIHHQLKRRK